VRVRTVIAQVDRRKTVVLSHSQIDLTCSENPKRYKESAEEDKVMHLESNVQSMEIWS
jgi:hypothetical protein